MNKDNLHNRNILITGGAGAIGNNLVRKLIEYNPKKIIVIDNLSSGNLNFLPKSNLLQFEYCDITKFDQLSSIFKKFQPNIVFHLAAHFANQNSVDYPFSDLSTNVLGTLNTLQCFKDYGDWEKFILTSSSCVYSNNANMEELSSIYPYETPYAITKFTSELYAKYFSDHFSLDVSVLRLFNSYGPYELAGKYRNVIPNFIYNALNNIPINITGDGSEIRDFTYISDTINLICESSNLDNNYKWSLFNSGTGKGTEILYLAESIIKYTGSNSKIIYSSKRSWDNVKKRVSNICKAEQFLQYKPKIELEEGLLKTIDWYKRVINE